MDEIAKAVEDVKKQWHETSFQTQGHIKAIEDYDKSRDVSGEKNSLPRLNGLAQDGLAMLNSLQLKLDTLAPQLPTYDEVQSAQALLDNWKEQSQSLRIALRNANLQAKVNSRKTAQKERELLLGGGSESTMRRRNLQTKAGMTSTAESITESLRRSRQIMAQELDRSTSTLMTFEESSGTLKKAESEYKGHRSLLMRTRNLLSTMQRQDVIDRVIIVLGLLIFSLAVLYVVSKRIGILKLQRVVVASIKADYELCPPSKQLVSFLSCTPLKRRINFISSLNRLMSLFVSKLWITALYLQFHCRNNRLCDWTQASLIKSA